MNGHLNFRNIKHAAFTFALLACISFTAFSQRCPAAEEEQPLYKDQTAPIEARISDLLPRLTLEEKILMIHGDSSGMDTTPIPRLGIPRLSMTDGPHGVRHGQATAFPPGVVLASTWNESLLQQVGAGIGRETLAKGRNIILGPCTNIHRVPVGGRNFESYSEDPFLASRIAVGYIKGVQSVNCMATVKHYAANNQEWERGTISVEIDERTLREIYLPHFEAAIKEGGSWSIMCSYNRINGTYACENPHILTDILKNEWGFKGFVMSDWGAVHSTDPTALSGMDVEMPNGAFTGSDLLDSVKAGRVPESVIDDKVVRILRAMMATGLFDRKIFVDGSWVDSPQNRGIALQAAREGIVLLKNDNGVLPLDRNKIKTLAVIGPNAAVARVGGGGSSVVSPFYKVSPLEGIYKEAGADVEVRYAQGCDLTVTANFEVIPTAYLIPKDDTGGVHGLLAEYYDNQQFNGDPVLTRIEQQPDFNGDNGLPAPGLRSETMSIRYTGELVPPADGKYTFTAIGTGITHLYINGKLKINGYDFEGLKGEKTTVPLKAGERVRIKFEYSSTGSRPFVKLGWTPQGWDPIEEAAKLAASSDAAVVIVGLDMRIEGEGNDREDIELPGRQNELVAKVLAANPRTAVVLVNGTPLHIESWVKNAPALVEAWYPGEEGGRAIAEILFGDVNPSGKLPVTLPVNIEQTQAFLEYPGGEGKVHYNEGIFVGYRYYDTKNIDPLFPFGHGLSYTTFAYKNLKISPEQAGAANPAVKVTMDIENTGTRSGQEVVQLYVSDKESSVPRPLQELKGIKKIRLEPGEKQTVTFELDGRSFSFYDVKKGGWTAEPGAFEIRVGSSSRDIRLTGTMELK